ncbi:MAG: ABC transporter substrate-binding protein [Alphaproteobacteria bacterium]|nr:ABC transporter substrate-binding protein [Alphaproteobacteria bacterium]
MLRAVFMAMFLPLVILAGAERALAAGEDDARQFVDAVGKQVLQVINSGGGEAQKKQQLQQLFAGSVDIDWMAKFVLGKGWGQATEEQRQRYMQVYRQYLLTRYTANFADYTGSNYNITGVRSEGDGQYTVSMQIKSPRAQQQETEAGYRVHAVGGQFKIIDIIIESVSLITTQRSEFASVLQQKGMDGLISAIEGKIKAEGGGTA